MAREIWRTSTNNVWNAWEYYIAARLSAEDFIATITLGRAERYDIIAISENWKWKTVKISVKARYDIKQSPNIFRLSAKDENLADKDAFYAFVRLKKFESEPDFRIVPAPLVAELTKKSHQAWLNWKSTRNDSTMRSFSLKWVEWYPKNWEKEIEKYKENLDLLK
jgi:hypothetical protein